jgi:hypothetical protein
MAADARENRNRPQMGGAGMPALILGTTRIASPNRLDSTK